MVTDVSGLGGAAAVCFSAHVVLVSFSRFAEPIGTGLLAGSIPKDTVGRSSSIVSDLGALLIWQQAVNRQGQVRWQGEQAGVEKMVLRHKTQKDASSS